MSTTPLTAKEMIKITWCLTITCLIAAALLGVTYRFTQPIKERITIEREGKTVSRLLGLEEGGTTTEVRRYLYSSPEGSQIGYLLADELQIYTETGDFVRSVPRDSDAGDVDEWVLEQFPLSHYVGRFFIGKKADGSTAGYLTEAKQQGFKNNIRFFVALNPDFTIRGVEVAEHEEDPGLGAEIAKPYFKNQFVGRALDSLATLEVKKDPLPASRKKSVTALEEESFETWQADSANQFDAMKEPIYAVTGATISSRALSDGVKKAVTHLSHRLTLITTHQGEVHE